jgi:hypothetical protein
LKAPDQFKWTRVGELCEGILVSVEPKTVAGKTTPEYLFQRDDGTRFTMLALYDLERKIQPDKHVGYFLSIRYEKDDDSFKKDNQSAMKIFKVVAAKEKEPGF